MIKADMNTIFWLGSALGALAQALRSAPTGESLLNAALTAENRLKELASQKQFLPVTRDAAKDVITSLNGLYYTRFASAEELTRTGNKPVPMSDAFTAEEVGAVGASLFGFPSILSSELPQANIYYVTRKCAYDTAILMNEGEYVLPEGTLDGLENSKEKVLNDIREATRCLAVNIPTAVGFHIYRVIEAIIVDDYFPLLGITEKPSNRNLGEYIRILKEHGVDEKITAPLFHIKNHYRNPISHPEEFWDQPKANGAFGLATSVITIMSQDVASRRPKPETTSTEDTKL